MALILASLLIPIYRDALIALARRPSAVHAVGVEAVAGLTPRGGVDDAAAAAEGPEFGDHVIGDLLDFLVGQHKFAGVDGVGIIAFLILRHGQLCFRDGDRPAHPDAGADFVGDAEADEIFARSGR